MMSINGIKSYYLKLFCQEEAGRCAKRLFIVFTFSPSCQIKAFVFDYGTSLIFFIVSFFMYMCFVL